jgi:hypothetical protein
MLKNVLIGTNVSYNTTANSPADLSAGQIGVFGINPSTGALAVTTTGNVATQVASGFDFMIAQGVPAGKAVKTFIIKSKQKIAYSNTAYAAPVPNVFVVGYDGVSSSYDLAAGAAGTYDFKLQNITVGNPPFPTVGSTPFFNTAAAATSIAIAKAIVKDVNNQQLTSSVDVMPSYRFAFAEILSSATTAAPTSTPTATVVNGSENVTLSTSSVDIVPGVFIKFGAATGTTLAVYEVASVSGTAVTLSSPYVNASAALGTTISGLTTGFATAATVNAARTGIRVTEFGNMFNGIQVQEPQPNKILNVSCNVNLSGTPVQNNQLVTRAYTAAAGTITTGIYTEGNGTYAQVFKAELTAAGYIGFINRTFLPDNFPLYTVNGTNYVTHGLTFNAPAKDYTAQNFKFGEIQDALLAITSGASQITDLNTILTAI